MPWKHFWDSEVSLNPPPQLYPREYHTPGSSLYLFKQLPRLDPKEPIIEKSAPTEVSSASKASRYMIPNEAHGWPSLPPNLIGASIAITDTDPNDATVINTIDSNERWHLTQSNTCLFAGDNHGGLYPFIHGTFLVGTIESKPTFSHMMSIVSADSCAYFSKLSIQPEGPLLSLHSLTGKIYQNAVSDGHLMDPDYRIRDILVTSTATRDLALYAARNCDEAMIAWMGGGGREGAREQNQKWCSLLENIQTRSNPQKVKDVKRDLIALLFTGIPLSTSLIDHIHNGSQTTERNFKKWQSIVTEALSHVKHVTELAILALQRLISLLWDLHGIATVKPTSTYFLLDQSNIRACIEAASSTVETLSLMLDTVRRETRGFSHFMMWLRNTIPSLTASDLPQKAYDIVLVHAYITGGLFPSAIDSFFQPPRKAIIPDPPERKFPSTIREVAANARKSLQEMRETKERATSGRSPPQIDQSNHPQTANTTQGSVQGRKNIVTAMNTVITKCNFMFQDIASAITATHPGDTDTEKEGVDDAGLLASNPRNWKRLLLPPGVKQSIYREEGLQLNRLQDILLRERLIANEKVRHTTLVNFSALEYRSVDCPGDTIDVEKQILALFDHKEFPSQEVILSRSRGLPSFKGGDSTTLAVSSERGVAVILDHQRWLVQSFDLNSDEDGEEAEDQSRLRQEFQTPSKEEEISMIL
ncbi:hypothetical protein FRC17_011245 [Serendipita sp. 399]|nr:hypothetical protein FRC17_011245 [Serendipita sp. 399]